MIACMLLVLCGFLAIEAGWSLPSATTIILLFLAACVVILLFLAIHDHRRRANKA